MLICLILFFISFIFSLHKIYLLSGICLFIVAIYLYYKDYKRTKSIINLRGVFLLSFISGMSISSLKLSYLQKQWKILTWICFFLTIFCFYYSYEIFDKIRKKYSKKVQANIFIEYKSKNIIYSIIFLSILSILALIIEAIILGYLPLFVRGVPHAYSYFHISGLHYFTVSTVLIPSISIIYFCLEKKERNRKKDILVGILSFISLIIPILLVSRFQFIFAIFLALITYISIKKDMKIRNIILSIILILPIYICLSIARSHNIAYLNSIFEMKKNFPIYFSQPYIYIANNYDNFNEMVKNLTKHSYGLKSIFPLLALSGLKFKLANLLSFPLYITKKELTTLTIIYDAYYDFGIFGIIIFSSLLGILSNFLENIKSKNPIYHLIYAQICVYFLLSFFSTWFSNPSTLFYLIVSILLFIFIDRKDKKSYTKFKIS